MNKLLIVFLLLLGNNGFAFKADSLKTSNFTHELGFHIGSTSGYGPSYRLWYKRFGVQASFLPTINNNGYVTDYTFVYGFNLNYKLQQSKFIDSYLYLNSVTRSAKDISCNYGPWSCSPTDKFYHITNIGLGFGLDFKLLKTLRFSTQIGYGFYSINKLISGNIAGGLSLMYQL